MNTKFSCVGCGKCCNDHHVPLTLDEARIWAGNGGQIIVLVEGFLSNGLGLPALQREHAYRRSVAVRSGTSEAYVAITFAAYNVGPCRNLDQDNLCRIYDHRPLVCRIYPMEINPHIPLNTTLKDCPPESWSTGADMIVGGELVDQALVKLIQRSRQADRDDIKSKDVICALLGIRTTALKGDGFTAYLPDTGAFIQSVGQVIEQSRVEQGSEWRFHVSCEDIEGQVLETGAQVTTDEPLNYAFISLRAP